MNFHKTKIFGSRTILVCRLFSDPEKPFHTDNVGCGQKCETIFELHYFLLQYNITVLKLLICNCLQLVNNFGEANF